MARNYLELRGAQARRAVAEENAHTQRDTLRLTEIRRQIGPGDPVDVESARARLSATEAAIPVLRTAEARAAHRLAVLVGQRPGVLDAELAAPAAPTTQGSPTAIAIGDASSFLRRRPDVLAAERRLAAATARTGVATADLFPRVSVTGFVGFLSGDLSSLFKGGSQAWAVSPTLTWPGLDLGGARARLRAQEARGDASLAAYDQTVLRAIEDLQNALVSYRERQAQVVSLTQQVAASRRAAELAHIRYTEGRIDFLRVLDAERTRLGAEDDLAQAQTGANVDVVSIYKALGRRLRTARSGVGETAIHIDGLAGHHARFLAREVGEHADQIVGNQRPLDRLRIGHLGELLILRTAVGADPAAQHGGGPGQAGRQRIDRDPMHAEVAGQPAGEADDAALAGDIDGQLPEAEAEGVRGEIDDPPPAVRDHRGREGLGGQEHGVQVSDISPRQSSR